MKFKVGDEITLRAKVFDTRFCQYGIQIGEERINILPKDVECCATMATDIQLFTLDNFMEEIEKWGEKVHILSGVERLMNDKQIKDYFVHSITLNDNYIITQYVLLIGHNAHRAILFECDLNGYFSKILYDRLLK